jgi:uridine kinase
MVKASPPVIIGISGGTGSGKTTVANVILSRVGARDITVMAHDAYYRNLNHLPFEERKKVNFDHPNSLETELLIDHLKRLRGWQPVEVPVYDFTTHRRTEKTRHVDPRPIILVDGILIFVEPELRELFDVKIFVDTPADVRFIRRLQRDIEHRGRSLESVIEQYQLTVRPMHEEFVEPSKLYADVIIPEGGLNTVAMDMVVARIAALLAPAER